MKKIGVSILAVTLALFLAVPAMAEVNPYGSIRLGTFWETYDPGDLSEDAGADDDSDLRIDVGNFSRFGAKFKTGDLGGHVEFGLKGDTDAAYHRLLYGTWDFGAGTLLVGQDYDPYTFISDQIAPSMTVPGYDLESYFIGFGALWDVRQPQIKVKLNNGFFASLIQQETWSEGDINDATGFLDGDIDKTVPKICVGYEFKTEDVMLRPGLAYNTFNAESDAADFDETVNSYLVFLNGKAGLGLVDLQWSLHYGQNLTDFGILGREAAASAQIDDDGDIENSTCYGGYIQAAFKLDSATVTLGYGYVQSTNDEYEYEHPVTHAVTREDDTDAQQSYFVNAKIPIADTFFVVPEFSYYDLMDDPAGNEEDDTWYLGLMWRMDF